MNNLPAVRSESLLLDVPMFEHAQRVARMLSQSTMVPEHFRDNIGNCVIALNYADRVGIDPFMAMQKMYIIHGKPAVETQLQIALFNKSGQFSALKYKITGEGDAKQCVAYTTEKGSGQEIEGPPVSIAMAKAEGWYNKNGSKWKTLPELMLRYRAAAFFIRLYAPETTLGLHTSEELKDMGDYIDVTPEKSELTVIDDLKTKAAGQPGEYADRFYREKEEKPGDSETESPDKKDKKDKAEKTAKKKPEPTVEPPAPVKTYDEIKVDDPNGLKAAIVEAGFASEKEAEFNDQCKAKVAEAYDFMN